ncbi:ammonia channel protein AmtB [Micromonospora luteifusca]|uniref:Ammonia channel protein AmtB n=1 Tax=Micromonospora luteifusca TaxID=709860 RepID=A0ABS2M1T3_9ACTN|nr:DUF6223 family protein [Micromonospora luteifusca]MBM7494386.1 ammonia channel protein AmtB [Micromonospora luteifusca]
MPISDLLAASTVDASTLTSDRIVATAAVVVALAGAIIGGLALARPTSHSRKRRSAVALAAGVTGVLVGGLVVVTADGGPGTGNGIVGGYAALVLGLLAALLVGLASARGKRVLRTEDRAIDSAGA